MKQRGENRAVLELAVFLLDAETVFVQQVAGRTIEPDEIGPRAEFFVDGHAGCRRRAGPDIATVRVHHFHFEGTSRSRERVESQVDFAGRFDRRRRSANRRELERRYGRVMGMIAGHKIQSRCYYYSGKRTRDSEAGRKNNRRVEFHIEEAKSEQKKE